MPVTTRSQSARRVQRNLDDENDKKAADVNHHRHGVPEKASLAVLNRKVQEVVAKSSWWEFYGVDWSFIFLFAFATLPPGFLLLRSESALCFATGLVLLGVAHSTMATKASHLAAHGSLCASPGWQRFWQVFFIEMCGGLTADYSIQAHIKLHHPYTNIIGLGDSSTWKIPFLPRYVYLFVAPLFMATASPFLDIAFLWGEWRKLLRCLPVVLFGLACNFLLLTSISGLSVGGALAVMAISRCLLAIPYIHVNIFQHIGLPMYSKESAPKNRLDLMSTAVLNLSRNPLLETCFGHSLISCHVEHHLFPQLSDNMCLKMKPVVSKYMKEHGLRYNEDTYTSRLALFIDKYEDLMVKLPPITEFVGIQ